MRPTLMQSLQASLCGECASHIAEIRCEHCHEMYCHACSTAVHRKGRRRYHTHFTRILMCGQCEVTMAAVECRGCGEFYCNACNAAVHSKGARAQHTDISPIDFMKFRIVKHDGKNNVGLDLSLLTLESADILARPCNLKETIEHCEFSVSQCEASEKMYIEVHSTPLPDAVCENVDQWSREPDAFLFSNEKFLPNPFPKTGVLPPHRADVAHYLQGFHRHEHLHDRGLCLVLTALASRQSLMHRVFASCEYRDSGLFVFQFFSEAKGVWELVTVDSLIPCWRHNPIFGRPVDRALWPSILTKAIAQTRGSYDIVTGENGDLTETLLKMCTGGSMTKFHNLSSEELWWVLQQVTNSGLICILAKDSDWENGLLATVTAEITSQQLEKDTYGSPALSSRAAAGTPKPPYHLVRLHNVFGTESGGETFTSPTWKDSSPMWTRTLREITRHLKPHDRIVWASVSEISHEFNSVLLVSNFFPEVYPSTYFQLYRPMPTHSFPAHARQLLIVVSEVSDLPEVHSPRATRRKSELMRLALRTPISEMEIEEIDLGDETDDEEPQMLVGNSSLARAVSPTGLGSAPGTSILKPPEPAPVERSVHLLVTVTQPQIKFGHDYELLLFRTSGKTKQRCVETPIGEGPYAGETRYAFPTHNRLPLEFLRSSSGDVFSRKAALDLIVGHYLLVVVPTSSSSSSSAAAAVDSSRFMVSLAREMAPNTTSQFEWSVEELGSFAADKEKQVNGVQ
eukprot:PhM_4_TR16084/c0_g1_i1/m.38438